MFYIHVSAFNINFKFCSFRYRKRTTTATTTTALLDDQKRAKIADASQSWEESSQHSPSQESSQPEEESRQSPSHQKLMLRSGFYKFVIYVLLLVWRSSKREVDEVVTRNRTLEAENQRLKINCDRLKKENEKLKRENNRLKASTATLKKQQSLCSKLLTSDNDVNFYCGIENRTTFDTLHDFVCKFVKRRWRGFSFVSSKVRRAFRTSPKKFGVERKLSSQDEFLMSLMWIRLGLLKQDLAGRFNISPTLCSQILNSWISAMASVFKLLIIWPTKGCLWYPS